jgi:hypothetical protein
MQVAYVQDATGKIIFLAYYETDSPPLDLEGHMQRLARMKGGTYAIQPAVEFSLQTQIAQLSQDLADAKDQQITLQESLIADLKSKVANSDAIIDMRRRESENLLLALCLANKMYLPTLKGSVEAQEEFLREYLKATMPEKETSYMDSFFYAMALLERDAEKYGLSEVYSYEAEFFLWKAMATRYEVGKLGNRDSVYIERDLPNGWVIVVVVDNKLFNMNKTGNIEYPRLPLKYDEKFLQRCRFATKEEAYTFLQKQDDFEPNH